jgi:membrane protein
VLFVVLAPALSRRNARPSRGRRLATRLLERLHGTRKVGRTLPPDAPRPQPELEEPRLADPGPLELSRRDYVAIVRRALKETADDNLTNIAAALAYYAFLALPSVLMVAVGTFGLVGDPSAAGSLVGRLSGILPGQAQTLLKDSLATLTQTKSTGAAVLAIGTVLALWSLTGAMQNVIWGLNIAYERDETRPFIRRRLTSLAMVGFAGLGVLLVFGLLVLGPQMTTWIGNAVGQETLVSWAWWIAEWPVLIAGLLVSSAGIYYLGPNVKHPRWQFLSFGAIFGIVVWLAISGAFAVYVSKFGSYNKSWGSLSAVVVLLTWLWLSSLALLIGAEINAEAERSRELRRGEHAETELQAPTKT